MNITMEQVLAAQAAGYQIIVVINGEEYELKEDKNNEEN